MHKRDIRQSLLFQRAALAQEAAREGGLLAQRLLLGTSLFADARTLALYSPVRNEVDTDEILRMSLAMGKRVLFPSVAGESMSFRAVAGPEDLEPGTFGILEPKRICPSVDPSDADLILVPGVAFDLQGRRIGYGKGFYDKALHRREGSGTLVGFCYHFQLVERIPVEPHDVVMDLIVTDREIVCPPAVPA